MAPPNRPLPRQLTVIAKRKITPNMLRVTLGGPGMDGFPAGNTGGYVKLNLPNPDRPEKMLVRTYTIRHQRSGEIDLDFALHGQTATGSAGPATEWAQSSSEGDVVSVGGPGPAKPLPGGSGPFLVVGDMTALPAISVNLELLDKDATGIAVIEIMDESDAQDLPRPAGVQLYWVVTPQPGQGTAQLVSKVKDAGLAKQQGSYVWSASEFGAMQALRSYFREDCGLGPDLLYISSYWKSGLNEDAHKVIKREDAEAQ